MSCSTRMLRSTTSSPRAMSTSAPSSRSPAPPPTGTETTWLTRMTRSPTSRPGGPTSTGMAVAAPSDGVTPDSCPLDAGNSTVDRYGCLDRDGDGVSDPDPGNPAAPTARLMPSGRIRPTGRTPITMATVTSRAARHPMSVRPSMEAATRIASAGSTPMATAGRTRTRAGRPTPPGTPIRRLTLTHSGAIRTAAGSATIRMASHRTTARSWRDR